MQQATVDARLLQKPLGHVDFLAGLVSRECSAASPRDTVIFVGPSSRYGNKIPEGVLPAPSESSPRFFYVRYESPRRSAPTWMISGTPTTDVAPERPSGPAVGRGAGAGNVVGNGGGLGRGGHNGITPAPLPQGTEGQTDIITSAVARMKGRTLIVHTPVELAKAIRKIEGRGAGW
jgi:hypothetical protein